MSGVYEPVYDVGDPIWIRRSAPHPRKPGEFFAATHPAIVVERKPSYLIVREWDSVNQMQDGKRGRRTLAAFVDCWPRQDEAHS